MKNLRENLDIISQVNKLDVRGEERRGEERRGKERIVGRQKEEDKGQNKIGKDRDEIVG